MRKFLRKLPVFLILLLIVAHSKALYLLYTGNYKVSVSGSEIYHSIFKSKQRNKAKKVLLGDSVGKQLFDNYSCNDTINSLACNQAISMAGQYILLKNYLETGNVVDTVYLLTTPFTFKNNLDQKFTFHYFLKPFYKQEFYKDFTETVETQIRKIPFYFLCKEPLALTSNWAPDYNKEDSTFYGFLSPISVEYLLKIKELSSVHQFKLIIIPVPTRLSKKPEVDKIHQNEVVLNKLEEDFKGYFDKIIFVADSNFIDNVHLKNPKKYADLIKSKFM